MKWIYFIILFTLPSCKSHFSTANDMKNIKGKVLLYSGIEKEGEISIDNVIGLKDYQYIVFREKGSKAEKIAYEDVNELIIKNQHYTFKKIDDGGMYTTNNKFYLVKRLTKANSRIQLYEYIRIKQYLNNNKNIIYKNDNSLFETDKIYQYYISLESMNKYETYNTETRFIIPNFEDKVSVFVKDCPKLFEKIKRKENGYFYSDESTNFEKRVEIWMRIIEEYNECK